MVVTTLVIINPILHGIACIHSTTMKWCKMSDKGVIITLRPNKKLIIVLVLMTKLSRKLDNVQKSLISKTRLV